MIKTLQLRNKEAELQEKTKANKKLADKIPANEKKKILQKAQEAEKKGLNRKRN